MWTYIMTIIENIQYNTKKWKYWRELQSQVHINWSPNCYKFGWIRQDLAGEIIAGCQESYVDVSKKTAAPNGLLHTPQLK